MYVELLLCEFISQPALLPEHRLDKLNVDQQPPQQWNNLMNHAVRTQPELQNNERNREPVRQESLSRADRLKDAEKPNRQREREYYTLQRDGEKYSLRKDGVSYMLQKDGERYVLHRDGERYLLRKDGEKYSLHKEVENYAVQKVNNRYTVTPTEEKYAPSKDGEKFLLTKDGERSALQKVGDRHKLQDDGHSYVPQKEVKRQLSLRETERYGTWRDLGTKQSTVHMVDKYGNLKEVRKYSTLREGNRYAAVKDAEKYATIRAGERYGFQMNPSSERSVTKISSITLQPAQAAAIAAAVSASRHNQAGLSTQNPPQAPSSGSRPAEPPGDRGQSSTAASLPLQAPAPVQEPDGGLAGSDRMQQLEARVRTQRSRELEDDTRSVTSYQTLPRNMPSHRTQTVHCYPAGYRTLPRNSVVRPDSICSVAGSVYDRAFRPGPGASTAEKRRSLRDDTMWQLYEWQQRQAFCRQSLVQPAACRYGTLPSTKTMGSLSEHAVERCVSTSPSHGSLALYSTFSPPQQQLTANPNSSLSEVSSPVLRGDGTLERRQRSQFSKYGCPSDRRSIAAAVPPQTITPQSLQGKTPEELTLLLIKLRRQQAEINSLREHTVAQLMALGAEGTNAKTDVLSHHLQRNLIYLEKQVDPDDLPDRSPLQSTGEADVETKLSRLCEKDKVLRMQEEKLQQLHREKHTLEAALQSASQELGEQSSSTTAAAQSLVQQRDVLQSGLLGTCRELSRVSAELERSWTEYEQLEADVSLARTNLLEQLEALGSPQTEPPSQQHIQIQKELWRIQDVMEALTRTKAQQRPEIAGFPGSRPLSSQQKNEAVPLLPFKEGHKVPARPPLPQCYDSSERVPHVPLHHSQPGSRPLHNHRPEERKASCRNGAHSQAPDYRLYKSEPELTTVNEEGDEANSEDKDKTETSAERRDTSAPKAPPYPVGIVAPRTKSPLSTPESATIASYVTLRKTRKPESRSDRPRSTADQTGEREFIRTRMSVEEQLERMRRNQEASSLREKRRGTLSRSSSFSRDSTGLHLQVTLRTNSRRQLEVLGLVWRAIQVVDILVLTGTSPVRAP
uniref:Pleckstrin homology domain containing, family A member 5 n=1 Tax=Cyprinodon variegatus TaxID=28743 RepID=A0A3Q2DM15_CYPVA